VNIKFAKLIYGGGAMSDVLLKEWSVTEGKCIYYIYEIPEKNKKEIEKLSEKLQTKELKETQRQKIIDKINNLLGPQVGSFETKELLYGDYSIRDINELKKTQNVAKLVYEEKKLARL
jgi:hypothetical protein